MSIRTQVRRLIRAVESAYPELTHRRMPHRAESPFLASETRAYRLNDHDYVGVGLTESSFRGRNGRALRPAHSIDRGNWTDSVTFFFEGAPRRHKGLKEPSYIEMVRSYLRLTEGVWQKWQLIAGYSRRAVAGSPPTYLILFNGAEPLISGYKVMFLDDHQLEVAPVLHQRGRITARGKPTITQWFRSRSPEGYFDLPVMESATGPERLATGPSFALVAVERAPARPHRIFFPLAPTSAVKFNDQPWKVLRGVLEHLRATGLGIPKALGIRAAQLTAPGALALLAVFTSASLFSSSRQ